MATEACPACGSVLPDQARFCPSCGRQLESEDAETVRRVVTVVFADLAGFTSLAEGRDPEAVKELLDQCFGAMVPVIEEHGGTVDKIIGDELMAVFGAPRAHEDDPVRAVHAALRLVSTLEATHPELVLRIGINTGEVIAGPVGPGGARTVTGDTVNTAHRLVTAAAPSEILVGERTHAASEGAVTFESRRPYELRGKRHPVVAYAAVSGRRAGGSPPEVSSAVRLVGRDQELHALIDLVDESADAGGVRFAEVTGEAGLGKTRLAAELHRRAVRRRPTRVLWGMGLPYGATDPWQPLGEALRPVFGIDHLRDADAIHERLRRRVGDLISPGREPNRVGLARLAELLGVVEPPTPSGPGSVVRARRHDEQAAVCRAVLEALASDRPLLLVIDDAQWVDELVWEFLAGLLAENRRPITVVAATRASLAVTSDALAAMGEDLHTVELSPLDEDATRELIGVVLRSIHANETDDVVLGPSVEQRIVDATGGNPFLVDQIVRYLIDRKILVSAERRWEVASDFASIGLPDTARAMVDARLDALPTPARRFLQNASVFGRAFPSEAAAELAELDHDTERGVILADLVDRGLLASDGTHEVPTATDMTFRHAVVRDAVYASMPIVERAEKHRRVARWLERHLDDDAEALIGQLAHHAERAVTYHRELEHTDPGMAQAAFDHLVRAAEDARRRDADREAEQWYQRAIQLGTNDPGRRSRTSLAHAEVLTSLRRLDRASDVLTELLDDPGVEAHVVAEARARLAVCHRLAGRTAAADDEFDRARSAWQDLGDARGEALVLRLSGWAELVAGRPRSALPKLLHAHDLEQSHGGVDAETLRSLAWCEFLIGENVAARDHLWKAAQQFQDRGDEGGIGWCFGILGFSLWLEGRIEQARTIAAGLLSAATGRSDPFGEGMCLTLLAACEVESGDVDAASDAIVAARRIFAEIDEPWGQTMVAVVEGMANRAEGRLDEAIDAVLEGLEVSERTTSVGEAPRLLAELASLELDAGDCTAAVEHARRVLELVRSGSGDRDSEIRALVALAREHRRTGDLTGARRLLDEALDLGDRSLPTSVWRRASAQLGMVTAELGLSEEAWTAASDALDGSDESVRTWVLAKRAEAAALAAAGDLGGARRALEDVLDRLGSRPLAFLTAVRHDLEQLTSRTTEESV